MDYQVIAEGIIEALEGFMKRFEERLAKRVVREVRHKLDYGTKN